MIVLFDVMVRLVFLTHVILGFVLCKWGKM